MLKNYATFLFFLLPYISYAQSTEYDSLLNAVQPDTAKLRVYRDITNICDVDQIPKMVGRGIKIADRLQNENHFPENVQILKAELLVNLMFYYSEYTNLEKCDSLMAEVDQLLSPVEEWLTLSTAYNNYAYTLSLYGNYKKAIEQFERSLELSLKAGDMSAVALRYNNIANSYQRMGAIDRSIDYQYKALKYYEEAGDTYGQALVRSNIGQLHTFLGNYDKAIAVLQDALEFCLTHGETDVIGSIYHNTAHSYMDLDDYELALELFDSAIVNKKRYNPPKDLSASLSGKGFVYHLMGDDDEAMEYYQEAIVIADSFQNLIDRMNVRESISDILVNRKEYKQAEDLLRESYSLAVNAGNLQIMHSSAQRLYELYKKTDNKEKALEFLEVQSKLRDTLFNQENRLDALASEIEYNAQNERYKDSIADANEREMLKERSELQIQEERNRNKVFLIIAIAAVFLVILALIAYFNKQRANRAIRAQKAETERQRDLITEKNQEIMDSITYAQRIQEGILPDEKAMSKVFNESFVFYLPKDQLSGDFYWAGAVETRSGMTLKIFSVADCTGHGVPGALVSILGLNYVKLGQTNPDVNSPAEALDFINQGVFSIFETNEGQVIRDGMDISLGALDTNSNMLYYAAAKNPIYLIRDNELNVLKGDKHSIGRAENEHPEPFTNHSIQLKEKDVLYLFSDGFADQFGGPKGKKYKYSRFKDLLMQISSDPMEDQKDKLRQAYFDWLGHHEQIDDVCVMGIRI